MQTERQPSPQPPRPTVTFTETFSSSENDKEVKFAIDKLLARGIQENNSALIVEEQPIAETNEGPEIDFEGETAKIAISLRIKYDRTKTATNHLQSKIDKMKQEYELLSTKHSSQSLTNNQIKQNFNSTESQLSNLNDQMESATLKLDMWRNMQERLKKDIIHYKKNIFDCNIQLRKKANDIRRLTNGSNREQRLSLRCKNLLESVEVTLNKNRYQRDKRIHHTDKAILKRRQYGVRQLQRSRHLQKSMQQALTMKLPQQRQLTRVFLANKFLKGLLHSKMESLMSKYQQINNAFTTIKQNTTVKTAEQLIKNYLFKDQTYGGLLESIAKAEQKIRTLKDEKSQLFGEEKTLEHQQDELIEIMKTKQVKSNRHDQDSLELLEDQLQKIDSFRNSITLWAVCFLSMVKKVQRNQVRAQYEYLGDLLGSCLRTVLKIVEDQGERQKSISQQRLEKETERTKVNANDLLLRNMRIKTVGAETFRDEEDIEYDMQTENEYLHMQRKSVKKRHLFRGKLQIK